jgi:hypothetical protein
MLKYIEKSSFFTVFESEGYDTQKKMIKGMKQKQLASKKPSKFNKICNNNSPYLW